MTRSKAKPVDPCWVFLAHCSSGNTDYLRIGYADNVQKRIARMQSECPLAIGVPFKWPARNRAVAKSAENRAASAGGFHPVNRGWMAANLAAAVSAVRRELGEPEEAVRHLIYLNGKR